MSSTPLRAWVAGIPEADLEIILASAAAFLADEDMLYNTAYYFDASFVELMLMQEEISKQIPNVDLPTLVYFDEEGEDEEDNPTGDPNFYSEGEEEIEDEQPE